MKTPELPRNKESSIELYKKTLLQYKIFLEQNYARGEHFINTNQSFHRESLRRNQELDTLADTAELSYPEQLKIMEELGIVEILNLKKEKKNLPPNTDIRNN